MINKTDQPLETVFSFHCEAFLRPYHLHGGRQRVTRSDNGFMIEYIPPEGQEQHRGWFAIESSEPGTAVDPHWFRAPPWDHAEIRMIWQYVQNGEMPDRPALPEEEEWQSKGGSMYMPVSIPAHGSRTVTIRFCWYIPDSDERYGPEDESTPPEGGRLPGHQPWYAGKFASIHEVSRYWAEHYATLREQTRRFTDTLYATTLDDEIMDAVTSNLCILKSPTVMRQKDGRLWCWEGSGEHEGAGGYGSCTHVWNYAQAICHLFPDLERTLRETEFFITQDERGHQEFRSNLPIRPFKHVHPSAADGQLGGLIKIYRDYHICADKEWLRNIWPQVKKSAEFCISEWDRDRIGVVKWPHINTYDIHFWGPNGMHQSIYVLAMQAMAKLAAELGEDGSEYERLAKLAKEYLETALWDGEYFNQIILDEEIGGFTKWATNISPESRALAEKEGPHYQYGAGCLSDGIIGDWMGFCAGLENVIDSDKVKSHLASVFKYNFCESMLRQTNLQRTGYACGEESGLLLCTWPKGGKRTMPFIYSDEVWTGIEYQVAAHMASKGMIDEALTIVKAVRKRYNGISRNPFNEYESGNWYARALSSYSLLQGFTGIRYDAVQKVLHIAPKIPGDFACFFCTASGYGLAGVENGKPFYRMTVGTLQVAELRYEPAAVT